VLFGSVSPTRIAGLVALAAAALAIPYLTAVALALTASAILLCVSLAEYRLRHGRAPDAEVPAGAKSSPRTYR
jgi:ammonia channel protein AmtB